MTLSPSSIMPKSAIALPIFLSSLVFVLVSTNNFRVYLRKLRFSHVKRVFHNQHKRLYMPASRFYDVCCRHSSDLPLQQVISAIVSQGPPVIEMPSKNHQKQRSSLSYDQNGKKFQGRS